MSVRNTLYKLFKHKSVQNDYIKLLRISQSECRRGTRATMGVGELRERDLVSVIMKYIGEESVKWDNIPDHLTADVIVKDTPISIKHKTVTRLQPNTISAFKVKWTSNADVARQHIHDILENDWLDDIIVSEIYKNEIHMHFLTALQIQTILRLLKQNAFKPVNDNSNGRGIEFSDTALNLLKNGCKTVYFPADLTSELEDPYRKRLNYIT
jgi:hypothetical protein